MDITEIRVKLTGNRDDKLRAFCTITFDDCFVVRDLKIIRGAKGAFVAMPSRKLADVCTKCGGKNHMRARFCNDCGFRLNPDRAERDEKGRAKLHADIAHPINQAYRERLQSLVLEAYEAELARADEPGYVPPSDEFSNAESHDGHSEAPAPRVSKPAADTQDPQQHRFGEGILP